MDRRLQLHDLLIDILGSRNVYFQPPDGSTVKYPCIIYSIDDIDINHANNKPYAHKTKYLIKLVDKNIETSTKDKILLLSTCKFVDHYVSNNLHHFLFNIYF